MNDQAQEKTISFEDFNLLPEVKEAIDSMGFKTPTPVQSRTYKCALSGNSFIAMAQTGTGKTAAFGIPIVQKVNPQNGVQALVLAPTRELALQVSRELCKLGQNRGIRCAAIYGGASFTAQAEEVKAGAQIVAGTPGRILDHIRRGTVSFNSLKMLVLDEADEMLSMGFEKELFEIMEALPKKHQTMLFSATIPDDIRRLSQRYMGEAEIISVSDDGIGAKDVSHFMYLVSGLNRQDFLLKVLEEEKPDSAIIFCNTREETLFLAQYLKRCGYNADWLNSDLSQNERERVMKATREGTLKFLVATDVAARGIDVSHLSHVINYTFPESLEVYVHRTGRTGRAGRQGAAVSLIAPHDIGSLYMLRLTYKIFPIEKTLITDAETSRITELERLNTLRKKFAGGLGAEFEGLARRIMSDIRGERIIAGLIGLYFENENSINVAVVEKQTKHSEIESLDEVAKLRETVPEKKAEHSTSLKETDVKHSTSSPFDRRPYSEIPQEGLSSPCNSSSCDSYSPRHDVANKEDVLSDIVGLDDNSENETGEKGEIYLNAGRKDGLRISSLMKAVMLLTGLPRTAFGKVRVLTRATFISVPPEYFDTVLKALVNLEVDGIQIQAEPAHEQ